MHGRLKVASRESRTVANPAFATLLVTSVSAAAVGLSYTLPRLPHDPLAPRSASRSLARPARGGSFVALPVPPAAPDPQPPRSPAAAMPIEPALALAQGTHEAPRVVATHAHHPVQASHRHRSARAEDVPSKPADAVVTPPAVAPVGIDGAPLAITVVPPAVEVPTMMADPAPSPVGAPGLAAPDTAILPPIDDLRPSIAREDLARALARVSHVPAPTDIAPAAAISAVPAISGGAATASPPASRRAPPEADAIPAAAAPAKASHKVAASVIEHPQVTWRGIEFEVNARVNGRPAGRLPLLIASTDMDNVAHDISVRLSDLVTLFSARMDPALLRRFVSSERAHEHVTLNELRAFGIAVAFARDDSLVFTLA